MGGESRRGEEARRLISLKRRGTVRLNALPAFVAVIVLLGQSVANVQADSAEDALALAQRTLAYVERSAQCPALAPELAALAARL